MGVIFLVNRAWEAVTGKTRREALGKSVSELFSPANAAALTHANQEVLRLRRPLTTEEFIDVSGTRRWFTSIKFPLSDSTGEFYAIGSVSSEITARKKLDALVQNHENVFAAMSAAQMGVWTWNAIDDRVDVTQGVAQLFGLSGNQFAVTFDDLVACAHPDDRANFSELLNSIFR